MKRKFLIKLILFILLVSLFNGLYFYIFLPNIQKYKLINSKYSNTNTEENLWLIDKNKDYEFVFLGTSRARTLSRYGNHSILEKKLSNSILNLACQGAGVIPSYITLEYFYLQGNKVSTVVYCIDPWTLFSKKWNENSNFANNEPFMTDFTFLMFKNGINIKRILSYLQKKINPLWLWNGPVSFAPKDILERKDSVAIKKRINFIYPNGLDTSAFNKYSNKLELLIKLAKNHGSKVVFVQLPTMLGREPGDLKLSKFLKELNKKYNTKYLDLSQQFSDSCEYFLDHDHLNKKGEEILFEHYLSQFLKGDIQEGSIKSIQ